MFLLKHFSNPVFVIFFSILLNFSYSYSLSRSLVKNIVGLSLYGTLVGATTLVVDDISKKKSPQLYVLQDLCTDEDYLELVEKRALEFKSLLGFPINESVKSCRINLLKNYSRILQNRNFLSKIFHRKVPNNPWKLLDLEIEQHLSQLAKCRLKLLHNTFTKVSSEETKNCLYFFDRTEKLGGILLDVRNAIHSFKNFPQ